jgi:mRNA-degrading endonuclease toxin of MazEF toxin-antitoxin module
MDTATADILSRHPVPRHRLTRLDCYRLAEVDILNRNDRVELLEGLVVDMSPSGPRHALVVGETIANAEAMLLTCVAGTRTAMSADHPTRIALVDTGNTGGSVVAEALASAAIARQGINARAISRAVDLNPYTIHTEESFITISDRISSPGSARRMRNTPM